MELTPQAMKGHPFQVGPIGIRISHSANPHFAHDPTDRVDLTIRKTPNGVYNITFQNTPTGSTIFLPYRPDEVHSVRLPANPGVGGATTFLTANLDGCCMYLDVKVGGDIVVYHANASLGVAPTMQQSATQPLFQTPACLTQLDTHYTTAAGHYAGTANTHHVAFAKARYLREVDRRLQVKTAAGRTGGRFGGTVEHGSLTTFAGFFINNRWEFWFQTYSQFIYNRPASHWKAKLGFTAVNPGVTADPYEVVESAQVFRAP